MKLFTVGHSTRTTDQLIHLLADVGVDQIVDVRSIPRSRTNPQFNADTLPASLATAGIAYHHLPALGGLRGRQKQAVPSPNMYWRNASFRNYADYALSAEFREGFEGLRRLAGDHSCAIMCAEAMWWRCHRLIITDYLLTAGDEVIHILGPDRAEPARPTPGVFPQPDGTLHYPPEQGTLV